MPDVQLIFFEYETFLNGILLDETRNSSVNSMTPTSTKMFFKKLLAISEGNVLATIFSRYDSRRAAVIVSGVEFKSVRRVINPSRQNRSKGLSVVT